MLRADEDREDRRVSQRGGVPKTTVKCARRNNDKTESNFTCKKQSSALPAHQADSPFSRAKCGGAGPAEEEALIFSSGIAPVSIPRGSPPNDVKKDI